MPNDAPDLVSEALKLSRKARAALAGVLLESLEEPVDEDAEKARSIEIRRRLDDLNSGNAKTVPWSEVRRRILGM